MTQILGRVKINHLLKNQRRYKHKVHWSEANKKNSPKDRALAHFDDFYATVYGDTWQHIRAALLSSTHKYVAVVNNFGDTEELVTELKLLGAMDMRELYDIHKKNKEDRDERRATASLDSSKKVEDSQSLRRALDAKHKSELQSFYPDEYEVPDELVHPVDEDGLFKTERPLEPVQMRPLEEDLATAEYDENRIIKPSVGLTSSSLYEYVPATKLKGLEDYVFESSHYKYYSESADFSVKVEKEPVLTIPEHLKIYTFEDGNDSTFPQPRRGRQSDVYGYYLMDGASVLPVLALDLQPGDTMLDMCAAPGGKSLIALQTLLPRALIANDSSLSRLNHLNKIMSQFLGDLEIWDKRFFATHEDARNIEEPNIYNKILVDVPCTTDRHTLHNDDNNLYRPSRVKERLQLPEIQAQLLTQALKIVAPGGTVVYSTCSLSPIQNDGVVQMALKKCWEETQSVMIVKDVSEAFAPLSFLYKFGRDFGFRYGQMVIPTRKNNWGPLYFSKIVKIR